MNYTLFVLLVFALLKGRYCGDHHVKISAKVRNINENHITNASNKQIENGDVRIKGYVTDFESGEGKVQHVDVRGGDNETTSTPYYSTWERHWSLIPTVATFSLKTGIRMSPRDLEELTEDPRGKGGDSFKVKKKYQKYLLPLLLAYKLKFFTLIPVMMGGLLLLVGSTGLAGFFFALFAAVMGLKGGHGGH